MTAVHTVDLAGLFKSRQKATQAAQELNREFAVHQGTKGEATETSWIRLLQEYLPNRYAIERAMVVDSRGETSQQIDIVVFDRQYTPFVINYEGLVYIPAESVYAIFEVKQDISKENIELMFQQIKIFSLSHPLVGWELDMDKAKEKLLISYQKENYPTPHFAKLFILKLK